MACNKGQIAWWLQCLLRLPAGFDPVKSSNRGGTGEHTMAQVGFDTGLPKGSGASLETTSLASPMWHHLKPWSGRSKKSGSPKRKRVMARWNLGRHPQMHLARSNQPLHGAAWELDNSATTLHSHSTLELPSFFKRRKLSTSCHRWGECPDRSGMSLIFASNSAIMGHLACLTMAEVCDLSCCSSLLLCSFPAADMFLHRSTEISHWKVRDCRFPFQPSKKFLCMFTHRRVIFIERELACSTCLFPSWACAKRAQLAKDGSLKTAHGRCFPTAGFEIVTNGFFNFCVGCPFTVCTSLWIQSCHHCGVVSNSDLVVRVSDSEAFSALLRSPPDGSSW
jgi:hypothetical protein